jgi:hypothetical protein
MQYKKVRNSLFVARKDLCATIGTKKYKTPQNPLQRARKRPQARRVNPKE